MISTLRDVVRHHKQAVDADEKLNQYRDQTADIPPKKNRKQQIYYDKKLYKQRHKVENIFARLKDRR